MEELFAVMVAHAQDEAPNECCGLVVEHNGEPRAIPVTNISSDPLHQFEMAPPELIDIFQEYEVIGSYHSHPTGPPQPSSADMKFAHPMLRHWLVCDGKVLEWSENGLVGT